MTDERERIRGAVLDLVFEHGGDGTSLAMILDRAEVDRATFEREFGSREDCLLAIYTETNDWFVHDVFAAFESGESWRDSLRAAAYVAARFLRDHPREVRLNVIQIFSAGEMALAERDRYHQLLVGLVDAGRQELEDPDSISRSVAEGVVGSILGLMLKEVGETGSAAAAEAAVPELMYLAVRPYLGHEAARKELAIPPPPERQDGKAKRPRIPRTELRQRVQEAPEARYGPPVSKEQGPGDDAALRLARLPPGRHGLPREFVAQNQRDRLAAGIIATVAKHGLNEATITQISAAAGVSRRTFYAYFSSKEQCYFAAYDTIVEHLRIASDAAASEEAGWPRQVGAKLAATLEFLAANPDLAKFCLIAPQRAGEEVAARYRTAMSEAVEELCKGMPSPPATKAPSEAVAISLIGGMVALIVRKVNAGEGAGLPDLLPDLLELFLTPFLGRAEAVQVAHGSF